MKFYKFFLASFRLNSILTGFSDYDPFKILPLSYTSQTHIYESSPGLLSLGGVLPVDRLDFYTLIFWLTFPPSDSLLITFLKLFITFIEQIFG